MDDGFIFWPKHLDFKYFSMCLNNFHPAIKYYIRKCKINPKQLFSTLPRIEIFGH